MVKITPAQLQLMKSEASWVALSRHQAYLSCTILMMRTVSDQEDSVYEVIVITEQLNVYDHKTGLSYRAAIAAVSEQMVEEESW